MSGAAEEQTTFVLSFDARAIEEHFDGAPDAGMIEGFTAEALNKIGARACEYFAGDDRVWELFGECLGASIREELVS